MNKTITKTKKLAISGTTIRQLATAELNQVRGGDDHSKAGNEKDPCKPL